MEHRRGFHAPLLGRAAGRAWGVVNAQERGEAQLVAATPEGDGTSIAIDDASVYWTSVPSETVKTTPKDGGEVKTLAKGLGHLRAIAADASGVYFGADHGPLMRWTP